MSYTGVIVFGDSLVDAGNVLKLAEWYDGLPFADMPEGAPTEDLGYFEGRFSDGYTFADLVSNKLIGQVTQPIFPYHFEDPWIGLPIDPFEDEPKDHNLNFAYGGAQIIQGEEVVPDLEGQVDAFQDAADSRADPTALHVITIGGNDVRSLAPATADPVAQTTAYARLDARAEEMIDEIVHLISLGARHFMISGIPDVGLIPSYDRDAPGTAGYGQLEGEELLRSAAASDYSAYLDALIRTEVVPAVRAALVARGVPAEQAAAMVTYVPVSGAGYVDAAGNMVDPALGSVLPVLEQLHGLATGELTTNLLGHRELVFFDQIHPTAQVHALIGAYMHSVLTGAEWVEQLPLTGAALHYVERGSIGTSGEADRVTVSMVAGTTYRIELLGMSSLGVAGSLGDGTLRIFGPNGAQITAFEAGSGEDSGAGFDAVFTFTAATSGLFVIEASAVGGLTGGWQLQGGVVGGTAMLQGNAYVITTAPFGIIEGVGGIGLDAVYTSISHALGAHSEIELLTTNNLKGKEAIALTGNEFGQTIRGNWGANVIDGKGGADTLTGYGGKDVFVLADYGDGTIDRITDYARGDLVDVSQDVSVVGGDTIGGFVRVTTSGLIQVDSDGGGNSWVTLATVGGSMPVTVRYLFDGVETTATLGRVAETASASAAGWSEGPDVLLFGPSLAEGPLFI